MSLLIELQERLQEVGASLGKLESKLARSPDPSLLANIRSFQKYRRSLEREFSAEASERGEDVCAYRLFAERFRPTAGALARALGGFQTAFSVTYDALKGGPKTTLSVSREISRATELGIAYTYPGSFGVVMTIRNVDQTPLFGSTDSVLSDAVQSVFSIARAEDPATISQIAKSVGPAPIRAMYQWARGHSHYKVGADIEWRHGSSVMASLVRQYPQIDVLYEAIQETSDEASITVEVPGVLVGVDTRTRRFHFVSADENMKGRFTDAITESQQATAPAKYLATVKKTSKIKYSTEKEEVSYFLLKLEPIP